MPPSQMRIIFDNNGFAAFVQQPQHSRSLQQLKELVHNGRIEVIGTSTLLQELSGLASSQPELYLHTLSQYKELTKGKILRHAHDLVIQEGESCRPVPFEFSLLTHAQVENLFSHLFDPQTAQLLFGESASLKGGYAQTMEQARNAILSEPILQGKSFKEIASGYQDWFQHFDEYVQNWFTDLFDSGNPRKTWLVIFLYKVKRLIRRVIKGPCEVRNLPHAYAFLGYAFTRVYERFNLNKKDQDNDLFDRAHFTDAAVADTLVTNDGSFIRTALRVPNRNCQVLTLDELIGLINKWHGA